MEEADRLADDIVVLDHGRTVAHGTPAELTSQVGGDRIEVAVRAAADLPALAQAATRALPAPLPVPHHGLTLGSPQAVLGALSGLSARPPSGPGPGGR